VPTTPEIGDQAVRLTKWLVKEGDRIQAGTQLAILETNSGQMTVMANGNGFIRERLFPTGAEIKPGTPFATANADGEHIPYGKPYSTAVRTKKRGWRLLW